MKIIVQGDTHRNAAPFVRAKFAATKSSANKIVVVGDFGLMGDYIGFFKKIDDTFAGTGINVYALPGNHENHDEWNTLVEETPHDIDGFARVSEHVLLAPKVHRWVWGDKQFLSVGGAVSIDKAMRLRYEAQGGEKIWWENETTTDEDVKAVGQDRTDYLFTHDCSDYTPWKERLKPDLDSQMNRQQIDRVIRTTRPKVHFHGHMHESYTWENYFIHGGNFSTQTYGLALESARNGCGIFDTTTGEFEFYNTTEHLRRAGNFAL